MNVVLARRGNFDAATLSLLRRSPVLPDHRGTLGRASEDHSSPRPEVPGRSGRSSAFPARSYAKALRTRHGGYRFVRNWTEKIWLIWPSGSAHMQTWRRGFETALLRHYGHREAGPVATLKGELTA